MDDKLSSEDIAHKLENLKTQIEFLESKIKDLVKLVEFLKAENKRLIGDISLLKEENKKLQISYKEYLQLLSKTNVVKDKIKKIIDKITEAI
ncbi:MAG: hypothetical protein N2643_05060 [Endomicrobia bacterium]|nr:hypothetical protein [Endomicrobiia bacterium]